MIFGNRYLRRLGRRALEFWIWKSGGGGLWGSEVRTLLAWFLIEKKRETQFMRAPSDRFR